MEQNIEYYNDILHEANLLSQEQMYNLLKTQNELNEKYVKNWKEELTLEHFKTAFLTEFAEFLESSPRFGIDTRKFKGWKWWKTYLTDDIQNSKIEIIDMLHFGLSLHMLAAYNLYDYYQEEEHFRDNIVYGEESLFYPLVIKDRNNLLKLAYHYMDSFFEEYQLTNLLKFLQVLGTYHNMNLNEIYEGYFKKNQLNQHRIQNGYLDGSYEKVDKDGNEDNRKIEI